MSINAYTAFAGTHQVFVSKSAVIREILPLISSLTQ
jgi:hypothetical protein